MSKKQINRYDIISKANAGFITVKEAAAMKILHNKMPAEASEIIIKSPPALYLKNYEH